MLLKHNLKMKCAQHTDDVVYILCIVLKYICQTEVVIRRRRHLLYTRWDNEANEWQIYNLVDDTRFDLFLNSIWKILIRISTTSANRNRKIKRNLSMLILNNYLKWHLTN